jgi:hypothetical protein
MRKDAAIEEIRAVRHQISAEFGHDTKRLLDHYRSLEEQYEHRMLRDPVLSEGSVGASQAPGR